MMDVIAAESRASTASWSTRRRTSMTTSGWRRPSTSSNACALARARPRGAASKASRTCGRFPGSSRGRSPASCCRAGTGSVPASLTAEQFDDEAFREMFPPRLVLHALAAGGRRDGHGEVRPRYLALYSVLAGPLHERFFPIIENELNLTIKLLLDYSGQDSILAEDSFLQRAIMLRIPYVDPMSLLQVDLLQRWRESDRTDDAVLEALLASINGIASGLQNTG